MYQKAVVFSLFFVCTNVFAGTLTLEVSDDGDPLPMAEVILVDADTHRIVDSQFTDKKGRYVYSKSSGRFNIMVSKSEYTNGNIKNISLNDKPVLKKLDLVPSAFSEEVTAGFGDNSEGCDD